MHFVLLSVCPSFHPSVCLLVTFRVRAVTYICIDGLPFNLVQMLSSSRQCAVTLTRIHTSKVKVTQDIVRCYKSRTHFPSFFSPNNLDIDLYTTHNLNNFNKYPSITCSYIQEYFGYQSNNLYFLFFPFLTSGSVQFWSRFNIPVRLREKLNVLKKQRRGI